MNMAAGSAARQALGRAPRQTRPTRSRTLALFAIAAASPPAAAQDPNWLIDAGVTAVGLHASDSRLGDDQTLSADLVLHRPTPRGQWLVYLEGNSTLDPQAISSVLIESNADAGTALDPDRKGRIQLSELNYRFAQQSGSALTLGLLDASGFLDRTRITNDENVQFLGASFVNNPTIEFPDYTIGVVYERPSDGMRPQINAVLASANGLADNPNLSYSQLLRFSDDDDGAFAAVGLGWLTERRLLRVGAWVNTRPHLRLGDRSSNESNHGIYAVFGRSWRAHAMNLRLGFANQDVAEGSAFASAAYRYRWRRNAVGIGIARTFLSPQTAEPTLADSTQAELFGRFALTDQIHLTASLQGFRHSGFTTASTDPRNSATIFGLRLHYALSL